MPEALSLIDEQVVARTTGLMSYLTELVRPTERIRDAIDGNRVVWLDDYRDLLAPPGAPMLLELRHPETEQPPEVPAILSDRLDPRDDPYGPVPSLIRSSTEVIPPRIETAYRVWQPQWEGWAARARQAGQLAHRYRGLEELARAAVELSDSHELVLALALLQCHPVDRDPVLRHLLSCPVELRRDASGETLRLLPPLAGGFRLEDREFLATPDGFVADRETNNALAESATGLDPLAHDLDVWLAQWRKRCWRGAPLSGSSASLSPSPALILRPRGTNRLVEFYESVADQMRQGGAGAPLGLAQLVVPMAPDAKQLLLAETQKKSFLDDADPLLPLPTNQEQRRILKKLRANTAVVIQGPPGTGKTHTIANLICALLADGQRLLITSAKGQALRVLKEKIPPTVRDLCVLATGVRRGTDEELDRSITTLSDLLASTDLDRLRSDIDRLGRQRADLVQLRKNALYDLQLLREEEYTVHADYGGTLLDLVRRITAGRDRHQWIGSLPATASTAPPLTTEEAAELLGLLRTADTERAGRGQQHFPESDQLLDPAEIGKAFARLASAGRLMGTGSADLTPLLQLDPPLVGEVTSLLNRTADGLAEAGLPELISEWDPADWRLTAVRQRLQRRSPQYWQAMRAELGPVRSLHEVLDRVGAVRVNASSEGDAIRLLGQAKRSRAHLTRQAWWRRLWPPPWQGEAADLLRNCAVDGAPPATAAELDRAIAVLEATVVVENAERVWAPLGVPLMPVGLRGRVAQLLDIERGAAAIDLLAATRDDIERAFRRRGGRRPIHSSEEWDLLVRTCRGAPLIAAARDARERLDHVIRDLSAVCHDPAAAPETSDVIAALDRKDLDGYVIARSRLLTALVQKDRERRCQEMLGRLRAGHAELADMLAGNPGDPAWNERLADLGEAWAWGRVTAYCRLVGALGRSDVEQALNEIETRLGDVTRDLAARRAQLHCLSRVTESQRAALQDYRTQRSSLGRGKSAHKERRLGAARSAMREAQHAVPAWIMPLADVVDMMDIRPDAFDVVIVDEASQAGMDALFLLCLAPRVVIVGDDRQCAPGVRNELTPVQDALDYHLAAVPDHVRESFNPVSNLYELLSARFPGTIRLNEHFRCMPEIIGWSSRQFYQDRLIPLRQFGAERLDPLKVVRVEAAHEGGLSSNPANHQEALAIAERVERMVEDPAYRSRTIGVVVLTQSTAQTALILSLIQERVDAATFSRHDIRVGQPPDFQGDERDVILLSMTIARPRPALAGRLHERRFNVAASRARDQLWLFTSVAPTQLKPDDLRYSLITWMMQPPSLISPEPAHDLATPDVLQSPFTSLLHQQVFLELRRRGFTVLVAYPISESTIDLVVVGDSGRLAVECESPDRMMTPEQIAENLRRDRDLRRADWRFVRIRHSEYARDPDAALQPLWHRLRERGIEPRSLLQAGAPSTKWAPVPLSDREEDLADGEDEAAA